MKYSQVQKNVLSAVQLDVNAPIREIARRCGVRDHTARHALSVLARDGILAPAAFMDVYPLGLRDHAVYFSISGLTQAKRRAFVEYCLKAEGVAWFAEIGGDFQYALAYKCRDILQLHGFLGEAVQEFGSIFLDRTTATRIRLIEFGLRTVSTKRGAVSTLEFGELTKQYSLSKIDHEILSGLSSYPEKSPAELARHLGIPLSTLRYHQQALQRAGVLIGHRYLINYKKLGLQRYRLAISVRGMGKELSDQVRKMCQRALACTLFINCLGAWDYELELVVQDPVEVRAFCEQVNDELGNALNWIRVFSIFEERKFCSYPFGIDINSDNDRFSQI